MTFINHYKSILEMYKQKQSWLLKTLLFDYFLLHLILSNTVYQRNKRYIGNRPLTHGYCKRKILTQNSLTSPELY